MSDVDFAEQNDDGFEAEFDAARQEQDAPLVENEEEEQEEQQPSPEDDRLARLEKVAADKSRMAHAERRQRQEAEARASRLEERLNALERGGGKDAEIDFSKIPSAVDDPIGNLEALRVIAEKMSREHQEQQRQTQAQTQQERQFQQINTRMQEYEGDFRAIQPDYNDAAEFFRQSRIKDYEEQGYTGAELNKALTDEFVGLVARTMQSGKDPAEVVYNLAKNRGFGGEQRKPVVDKPSEKLQTIARGQQSSRSLSQMGGKQGGSNLTMESVSKLDGAEFDKAFARLREQTRKAG